MRPDRPPEVLYVSDALANVVNVFDAAKPYVSEGSITTGIAGPAGVALDGRSLLVANTDDVVEYDSGATSPSFTYTDGLRYPKSVLAGGNGLIYVADFSKKQITVFPRGTNKIEATIPLPGKPVALTMGDGANMYITTVGPDGTNVFELPPGSTTPKNLQLRFGHQIAAVVEGIAVDKSGNIIVADNMPGVDRALIEIFASGAQRPTATYEMPYFMRNISFDRAQSRLFVASPNSLDGRAGTKLYTFHYDPATLTLKADGAVPNACASQCYGVTTGP